MLIPNTLFRMGGAAMILTNRLTEYARAKYELQHVVRVHLGADDMAYECVPCAMPHAVSTRPVTKVGSTSALTQAVGHSIFCRR